MLGYKEIMRIRYWIIIPPSIEFLQNERSYAPLGWLFGQVKRECKENELQSVAPAQAKLLALINSAILNLTANLDSCTVG